MAYVESQFRDEDPDDLLTEMLARIQAKFPGWTPRETHLEYALLSEFGREAWETRQVAADMQDAAFRAAGEKLYGIPTVAGVPASGTVVFTMTDATAHTVPAGTQILWPSADAPVLFETVVDVANPSGSTDTPGVQVLAVEVGTAGNGLTAGPVAMVDPLSYVASAAATTGSSGGEEAETDAEYLDRVADSLRLLRRIPVEAEDFAILARDVPGVHRALAIDNHQPGVDEVQTVTVTSATGGTFTLTFEGQTTAAIVYNATAVTVQAALEALSNVAPGDVSVTGGPLGTAAVSVTFVGALGEANRTQMTATSSLTGTGAAVTTSTTTEGSAPLTNVERAVTVAAVDSTGTAVPSNILTDLQVFLDGNREVNFLVFTTRPTYTALTVTFSGIVEPGADTTAVRLAAEQAVKDFLSPALWAGGTEQPPVWRKEATVRYLDVTTVIGATPGLKNLTAATLNGGTVDVTLAGAAPLPAANPAVTGAVT